MASSRSTLFVSVIWFISNTCGSQADTCSSAESCSNTAAVDTPVIQLSGCNTDCGRVELYDATTQEWNALCFESIENKMELSQQICGIVGFPKLNSVYSYSTEHASLTATDTCMDSSDHHDCFTSRQSIADCMQNKRLYTKPISGGTLLGLSCQAANNVKLPKEYFNSDSIPFAIHFLNIFDSETAKLNVATEHTASVDPEDMPWLTVRSKDIEDAYIYSTDFLAENGLSRDAEDTSSDIDMDSYHYNMVGINLNALYDTLDMNSTQAIDFTDAQSLFSVIFNGFDDKIRAFQFSNAWGMPTRGFRMHALYHWVLDSPFRKQNYYKWAMERVIPSDDSVARSLYEQLHYDGIVRIEDWGLSSEFLDGLVGIYEQTLSEGNPTQFSSTSNGSVITVRREIESIEEYLSKGNMSLVHAIKAYLGSEVLLSGYKITKLTNNLGGKQDYHAGLWHHDRVGRRLKLFIFLKDIDCEVGRPTLVAQGTALLEYWRAATVPSSRFEDEFVNEKYNVMKGCGKRGGGFIFDTHTIHRAGLELQSEDGDNERLTVIAEYHNVIKCHLNEKYGLGMPCPSGDQYIVNRIL